MIILKSNAMKEWFNQKNVFFILSMGRSGTKFLASLIDSARSIGSIHEFYPDYLFYQAFFRSAKASDYYIKHLRMPYIYMKNSRRDIDTYGEVNSVLRRNAHSLKKFMPHAKILHLVRNPKDVVRSMMNRKTMRWYDGVTKFVRPPRGDMYYDKWPEMDRFERICWYWRSENDYIREYADRTVKFEDMLTDYDYFNNTMSMITGHTIDKAVWMDKVKKPKNVSASYSFPEYDKWNKAQKDAFTKICSKEMRIYGYEY